MKIVTYRDPFKIDSNKELWNMMQRYPQLCASDTLAQGLARKYNRCSFQYLRSIECVFRNLYDKWTNNAIGDMKIYLRVSSVINEIEDQKERRVFRNNIAYVIEAIKFLLVLGIEPEDPKGCSINKDQKILLHLYKKLRDDDTFKHFYKITQLSKADLFRALKLGVIEEVLREIDKQEYLKLYRIDSELIEETKKVLNERIDELEYKEHKKGLIKNEQRSKETINKLKHLKKLLEQDLLRDNKIIIHGIHRITPLMYFFFEQLQRQMNIEPIFVFNYCEEYPHIYDTWKKVYGWVDRGIISVQNEGQIEISKIGKKLGDIIEGQDNEEELEEKLITFMNLSNFSNIISNIYEEAYHRVNGDIKKVLAHMRIQYYATNPNKSNNILKMYYPEQFGEKQFLTYPIGQFILSLYSMWNFETIQMELREEALDECISTGVLFSHRYQEIIEIYDKIKLYFRDIVENPRTSIDTYIQRIDHLRGNLEKAINNDILEGFSFFNVSIQEIEFFKEYILELKKIAEILFKDMDKSLRYDRHFKKLIKTVNEHVKDNILVSELEKELINNVSDKLEQATIEEVEGLREDLKNAIFLYLSQTKNELSSQWIVRGFEQLDGAVLLSDSSKAEKYHIGLVSEANMSLKVKDELSWPLTESFLENYQETKQAVNVTLTVLREQRNFMKYSLFYVLAFAKKEIEIGYILEEDDKINNPYFLVELLGLNTEIAEENREVNLPINSTDRYIQVNELSKKINIDQKEKFAICPYKFFLTDVIHMPLIYRDEFQMRYLLSNYIQIKVQHQEYNRFDLEKIKEDVKTLFPFWNDIIINDVIKKALRQALANKKAGKQYIRRKKNFLVASWIDQVSSEKYMDFKFDEEYFQEYMNSSGIYMSKEYIPYYKICECCNLNKLCLMSYYWNQEVTESS